MLATATITSKGQVTIPVKVRQRLGLSRGDQLIFVEEDGRFYIENATVAAFTRAQSAFTGVAEALGLQTEQDVVDMINELRREKVEAARKGDV
jgi:AbrB family looped-hinge helix DNA binding protein